MLFATVSGFFQILTNLTTFEIALIITAGWIYLSYETLCCKGQAKCQETNIEETILQAANRRTTYAIDEEPINGDYGEEWRTHAGDL